MNRLISGLITSIIVLLIANVAHSKDDYWIAGKLRKSGKYESALIHYKKFIGTSNETKKVLTSYSKTLELSKALGKNKDIPAILSSLERMDKTEFDLRDKEKLAFIYQRYGWEDKTIPILNEILLTEGSNNFSDVKSMVRAAKRLFKIYKDDKEKSRMIYETLNQQFWKNAYTVKDLYDFAILEINYGFEKDGLRHLRYIVEEYPMEDVSKKALFILAEKAQASKDYDAAINYYSTYIERYSSNTFFVQKAYQRLVDCYILIGEKNLSKDIMKQVVDFINGTSDYRSPLNLAMDLKFKNMDKLAETTFTVGYYRAKNIINDKPGTYDALKAYLEIQRAAHALGKNEIVEQAAIATLRDFNKLEGNDKLNENVKFIKSQAYLWLARVYKEHEKYRDTIKILEEFLQRYPEHKDKDYALYELAKAYEMTGNFNKAKELYMTINSEPFKNKAKERLSELK